MTKIVAYFVMLFVGSLLIGGLFGFYNILESNYGSDFANDWIWIFAFLNTWGFLSVCSRGFKKIRGE